MFYSADAFFLCQPVTHEPEDVVSHNANLIHFAIHQPLGGGELKADHSANVLTIRIGTKANWPTKSDSFVEGLFTP